MGATATLCHAHPLHVTILCILELLINSPKEGQTHGFYHSLRKLSNKSFLAHHVSKPIWKVGHKSWDLLFPSLKLWENFRILKRVCAWDMLSEIPYWPMQC